MEVDSTGRAHRIEVGGTPGEELQWNVWIEPFRPSLARDMSEQLSPPGVPEILAVGLPEAWVSGLRAALEPDARLCEVPPDRARDALIAGRPAALIVDPEAVPGEVFALVQAAQLATLPVFWIVGATAESFGGLAIPTEWNIYVAPRSDGVLGLSRQIHTLLGLPDAGGGRTAGTATPRTESSVTGRAPIALIVGGNPAVVAALEQEGRARTLRTESVSSLTDARVSVERHVPDAIVLDILTPVRAGESDSLHAGLRFFEDLSERYSRCADRRPYHIEWVCGTGHSGRPRRQVSGCLGAHRRGNRCGALVFAAKRAET